MAEIQKQDPVIDLGEEGERWLVAGVWTPSFPPTDLLDLHFAQLELTDEYKDDVFCISGWIQGIWRAKDNGDSELVDHPDGVWYTVVQVEP